MVETATSEQTARERIYRPTPRVETPEARPAMKAEVYNPRVSDRLAVAIMILAVTLSPFAYDLAGRN